MKPVPDPFAHHPELRGKIADPLKSFFRDFRVEQVVEQHPELEWVGEFLRTDEERESIRLETLKDHLEEDLWVFAYGSLMWDPAIRYSEVRRARLPEYERRFILKDILGGRGNPEAPGLMAALDRGAGCEGLIFRIPQHLIDVETEILWRRELVVRSYIPTFVNAIVDGKPYQVLTFVADLEADQIDGEISRDEQIQCLVRGRGILGTSLEYLENVVAQFAALGVVDEDCSALLTEAHAQAREQYVSVESAQR